jgi:hypothetical protein
MGKLQKYSFKQLRNEVLLRELEFLSDFNNDGHFDTQKEYHERIREGKDEFKSYTCFEHLVAHLSGHGYDRAEAFEMLLEMVVKEK